MGASYDGLPPGKTDQASALMNAARNTSGSIGEFSQIIRWASRCLTSYGASADERTISANCWSAGNPSKSQIQARRSGDVSSLKKALFNGGFGSWTVISLTISCVRLPLGSGLTRNVAVSREIALCRCVGHRQGRSDGSLIMMLVVRADTAASCLRAPQLHGRILARARRCQGRASRFPAAAFAARPLTAPPVPARLLQPCK
jgi:hypothetical protein